MDNNNTRTIPINLEIHHIGYLVKNIESAVSLFECLGFISEGNAVYDDYRGIKIQFMTKNGYRIELVEPIADDSVVAAMYKKTGNSPYHICYTSVDFDSDIEKLRRARFVIWQYPHPAPAIDNKNVVFLYNSKIGLIELINNSITTIE